MTNAQVKELTRTFADDLENLHDNSGSKQYTMVSERTENVVRFLLGKYVTDAMVASGSGLKIRSNKEEKCDS